MSAKKITLVVFLGLLSLLPLFLNPLRYNFPVGYAGMFASFGRQLADENFRLPIYALGDVPFVYPPLGFYLMAIFLKAGISDWLYLRFMPALFSLLGLLVFFLIYDHFYKSKIFSGVALFLLSASPYLIESNVWAAGIVRGLAFAFFSLSFWGFLKIRPDSDWRLPALVGVASGLTILSHPGYAFFLALWMGIWLFFNLRILPKTPVLFLTLFATVTPWLLAVLANHPLDVFIHAFGSHGTLSLLGILESPEHLAGLAFLGTSKLFQVPLIGWLALAGFAYQIYQKRFELPVLFVLTMLFGLESRRFVLILGVLMAVAMLQGFYQFLSTRKGWRWVSLAVVLASVTVIFGYGLQHIERMKPSLTESYLDVAEVLRQNSQPGERYLIFADYQEAEWFPYFAERTPIFAHWAHEWQGDIGHQADLLYENFACGREGNLDCVNDVIRRSGKQPQYLVIMKTKYHVLIDNLSEGDNWKRLYNNREYQIWSEK